MNLNAPGLVSSPLELQSHLYMSFLDASTVDVALRVRGSWHAIYNLHRVVLIQSGFFRSLFTAGFMESSPKIGDNGPQEIVIHFDDPNITRPAFEICIARLYGGGPPLYISPSLIPSTSQPLTPDFPVRKESLPTPDKHHPATPRFLLSLLATSVYLSIPSIASQALSSILGTVGPHTVMKYLDFSLGKYIGHLDLELGEPEAAVGLEHVAQLIDDERSTVSTSSTVIRENDDILRDFQSLNATETLNSPTVTSLHNISDDESDESYAEISSHYGAISDRIGEACGCWLARWGTDLLSYEIQREEGDTKLEPISASISRQRSKTIPSDAGPIRAAYTGLFKTVQTMPYIWSRGGLSAAWVAAIVSADSFFVKGERERYTFARTVVELRRKDGIIDAEEEEWTRMFAHDIYYANMTMEDLIDISHDISPITKKPFVPLSILQAAHWDASVLRHLITAKPSVSTPPSPTSSVVTQSSTREKELGITHMTADILPRVLSGDNDERSKPYYLVPINSSVQIGASSNSTTDSSPITMDQLFASIYSVSRASPLSSPNLARPGAVPMPKLPTSESEFFGLRSSRYTASSCVQLDPTSKSLWSSYPPYRFGVEFWDLDSLKEKSRLYSQTISYGGSLFNVYVQVVRRKGQVQLGIYLHRQSSIEPIPSSSAPSSLALNRTGDLNSVNANAATRRGTHQRVPSAPSGFPPSTPSPTSHYSPSIHPSLRSTTPSSYTSPSPASTPSLSGSPSASSFGSSTTLTTNTLPATAPPVSPPQPYRDPRPSISAYFTVNCASATGSSLTRFTSSPDVFPVSQSWGWKSSSLKTDEYIDTRYPSDADKPFPGKEVSLRATVVLGLV